MVSVPPAVMRKFSLSSYAASIDGNGPCVEAGRDSKVDSLRKDKKMIEEKRLKSYKAMLAFYALLPSVEARLVAGYNFFSIFF